MKIRAPSCSAFAQNGWNFGSLSSTPSTLPPRLPPRSPYFFIPSSSCWAARSGCCKATVANATSRSGCAAQSSASFSFCSWISFVATSRSASYQYGLMLSASMSMPCASIALMRSETRDCRRSSASTCRPISAMASGNAQCACTSTVFTRLPFTTTSRRRVWVAPDPPLIGVHETKTAFIVSSTLGRALREWRIGSLAGNDRAGERRRLRTIFDEQLLEALERALALREPDPVDGEVVDEASVEEVLGVTAAVARDARRRLLPDREL